MADDASSAGAEEKEEPGPSVPQSASDDQFVQVSQASVESTTCQEDESGGRADLLHNDSRPDDAAQKSYEHQKNLGDHDIVTKDDGRDKGDVGSTSELHLQTPESTERAIVSSQECSPSETLRLEEADFSDKSSPKNDDLQVDTKIRDRAQAAHRAENLEKFPAVERYTDVLSKEYSRHREPTSSFLNQTQLEKSLMDLPADLRKNTTVLNCTWDSPEQSCTIYIVGTAHVSKESCKEVEAIIRHLKPQVVFLEICDNRVAILTPQNLKVPSFHDMLEMWRKKHMNPFGILYSWFLAKVANKLEVFPGAEFRVAYEEALACGAKVTLGDRPVQITLRRTWARMSRWHKLKLIFALCTQAFFLPTVDDINNMLAEMSDSDMITLLIQEMNKSFPTLMETLVDERDQFMTAILQKVARQYSSIVVVVGKGHVPGIIKYWGKDIRIDTLLESPQRSSGSVYFKRWGTFALAIGGIVLISGIYFSKRK